MTTKKIKGTAEAWESGELGRSEAHVRASDISIDDLQDSVGLQMISIRLQKELLRDIKALAAFHGLGYQPLIKQILRRWVDCEMKSIAREQLGMPKVISEKDGCPPAEEKQYA